jgi:hypothetical protein
MVIPPYLHKNVANNPSVPEEERHAAMRTADDTVVRMEQYARKMEAKANERELQAQQQQEGGLGAASSKSAQGEGAAAEQTKEN